jgi:hypothetical protein
MIVPGHLSYNLMNFYSKLAFCPNDLSCLLSIASITTTLHLRKQALAHANPLKQKQFRPIRASTMTLSVIYEFQSLLGPMTMIYE